MDSSISAFDVVHISRDIADDPDRVRDWCLAGEMSFIAHILTTLLISEGHLQMCVCVCFSAACEEKDSCTAVSVASKESAVRCVMYPDSHVCLPTYNGVHCVLLTKEPAQYVYIRTGEYNDLGNFPNS